MGKEADTKNAPTNSGKNIFDEFIQDKSESTSEKSEKKSYHIYDYLRLLSKGLVFINIILFILIVFGLYYNMTQNNSERKEFTFLEPICSVLLGDIYKPGDPCYSVSSTLDDYESKFNTLEKNTIERIFPLLSNVYSISNFNFSDKVVFLNRHAKERLKPLVILQDFDAIKTDFTSERSNIECKNITISENIMSLSCDVYSSDWDTSIINLQGGVRSVLDGGGTSISRASSFINFLENHDSSRFRIIEKPQVFSSSEFSDDGPYTQFTTIDLTLQYVNPEFLSF